ncbi:GntR family transcriptional regulator [Streptomyces gardneri]|uniref:HTH gntR-type domain-containing protein n=1 Tax=Streptomyces gardneri TaxID=66892 RepID=A0A4Y3RQB5_9ACTN|nr:GntR family transcriptional regulator [Streptomyces gardneri]GEB58903.1 hypothetical protein SGA01_45080 [Streptomyces gardneri]GHG83659.1 hypothetical protein GCM10017674_06280 [Streptomyces gardneri]
MGVPNDRIVIPAAVPGKTALYRFFNEAGQLLYVGVTGNPEKRWADHRRFAATTWWPLAARVTVKWYEAREEATAAELRDIRTKAPLYNAGGAPSPLRELAPDEKLCPHTSHGKFFRETGDRFNVQRMHMHEAVADVLAGDIRDGRLVKGSKLPTATELVARFGVGVGTVRRAISHLVAAGQVIVRGEGSGTRYFVAE